MTIPSVPGAVLQEGSMPSQALLEAIYEQGARAVPISERTGWWGGRLPEMHNENDVDQGRTRPTFLASGSINISGQCVVFIMVIS